MIKQDGNKVAVSKELVLTKRQEYRLARVSPEQRTAYLLTLLGLSKTRVHVMKDHPARERLQEGRILNQFQTLLYNDADTLHRPVRGSKAKWIGVEIECLVPGEEGSGGGYSDCYNCEGSGRVDLEDDNGNEYTPQCASCGGDGQIEDDEAEGDTSEIFETIRRKLRQAKVTRASVKQDGSLSERGHVGVEVTILLDPAQGFDMINRVCKVLNDVGAIVNSTCGLHVHLDQRDRDAASVSRLGARFGKFLPILSRLVPSSRRTNRYCHNSVSDLNGERYHAVNLTAFNKYRTVEVRLHSGTTDPNKIINWIKLLRLIEAARTPSRKVETLQKLIDLLPMGEELTAYLDTRFQKFNRNEGPVTEQPLSNDDELQGEEVA